MLLRTDLNPFWNPALNSWVAIHGGGNHSGPVSALGSWKDGVGITGGIVFHSSNGVSATANIALLSGVNPGPLIKAGLTYAFGQLGLTRLTFLILPSNIRSIHLVTGLGAYHEATLRETEPEGDLHIYALFADSCPIWSRIRGKIGKCPLGPGLFEVNPPPE